ncbi:MAG: bifunctional demethylmenaquinone methyltransferase/2-methoxy-6-polyprenyl-1,4-benzoquinol methylase UbiE [Armatimonadota bacterium]
MDNNCNTKGNKLKNDHQLEEMFSSIAHRYDLLNSIISLNLHHRWRKKAAELSGIKKNMTALDICCGTGDMAFALLKKADGDIKVIGIDISQEMLNIAKKKSTSSGYNGVTFLKGNMCRMPFDDNFFDVATIAFGLRNITNVPLALKEACRVLKPNGKIVCLEISIPKSAIIYLPWKIWFSVLTPIWGKMFRSNKSAYRYLPESVNKFMKPEEVVEEFIQNGFCEVKSLPLSFGFVTIYTGIKAKMPEYNN